MTTLTHKGHNLMHTSRYVFQQSLKTPLDCPCGGSGVLMLEGGDTLCPIHFEMAESEEHRLECLGLCYSNLRNFTITVEKKYNAGLPKTLKDFDSWVRQNSNPKTPEEWVEGAKSLVEQEVGYVLFDLKKGILG